MTAMLDFYYKQRTRFILVFLSFFCLVFASLTVLPTAYAGNTWQYLTSLNTPRAGASAVVLNGEIYVLGGWNSSNQNIADVEAYNPATNTWTAKPSMLRSERRLAAVVVNGKIYVIGNGSTPDTIYVDEFDPNAGTNGQWVSKLTVVPGRTLDTFTGHVYNGKIYVFSEVNIGGGVGLATVDVYDPTTNTWTARSTSMPTPTLGSSSALINGKIYVLGGQNNSGQYIKGSVQIYDIGSNSWSTAPNLGNWGNYAASATVMHGKIFIVGGVDMGGSLRTVREYDVNANSLTARVVMQIGRTNLSTVAINGKLYAIGGGTLSSIVSNTVEEYTSLYEDIPPATTITPAGGTYTTSQTVTMTCADNVGCANIYYTTDGSTPTIYSSVYNAPIAISTNTVLKYFSLDVTGNSEPVQTANYIFDVNIPAGIGNSSSIGDGSVSFNWSPVAGATSYNVCYQTTPGVTAGTCTKISGISSNSYVHTGLTNGTTYYYCVSSVVNGVESGMSNEFSATPESGAAIASMTAPRSNFSGIADNGTVYLFGGSDASNNVVATVEAYDSAIDTWTTKTSMPTGRTNHCTAQLGNKVYAIGGKDRSGNAVSTVDEYDIPTDTWNSTPKAPLLRVEEYFNCEGINGLIYVMGGTDNSGNSVASMEVYDPVNDTWKTSVPMPKPRSRATSSVVNGKVYVIGGYDETGLPINTVDVYDPGTNRWTTMPTSTTPPIWRAYLRSVPCNNRICVFGGRDDQGAVRDIVEEYNPTNNTWRILSSMQIPREAHWVCISGRWVLVFGGKNTATTSSSRKIYSPLFQSQETSVSHGGGRYDSPVTVTLICQNVNGFGCNKTYYTTNGSTPTTNSPVYVGPISISSKATLKFFSDDSYGNAEQVKTEGYEIGPVTVEPLSPTTFSSSSICATYALSSFCSADILSGSLVIGSNATVNFDGPLTVTRNLTLQGGIINLNQNTLTVQGDLIIDGGNLQVQGGKLIVLGNIIHQDGVFSLQNGTVDVYGDYRGRRETINPDGSTTFANGSGTLDMSNCLTCVFTIQGNFIQASTVDHTAFLTSGEIRLAGDFTQDTYGGMYDTQFSFPASGSHLVILNGNSMQTVSFFNPSTSYFNKLDLLNASAEGVIFQSAITVHSLFTSNNNVYTLGNPGQSIFCDYDGDGTFDNEDPYPTIADITPPIVTVPDNISTGPDSAKGLLVNSSQVVSFLSFAYAWDETSGTLSVTNNAPTDFFPVGTTEVIFFAVDVAGNVGTASATVTVSPPPVALVSFPGSMINPASGFGYTGISSDSYRVTIFFAENGTDKSLDVTGSNLIANDEVKVYLNGTLLGTQTNGPVTWSLPAASQITEGENILEFIQSYPNAIEGVVR